MAFADGLSKCERCGKLHTVWVQKNRNYRSRFCSKSCGLTAGATKECELCNSKFKVKPSHLHRRKFCSIRCKEKAQKHLRTEAIVRYWKDPAWRSRMIEKIKLHHADVSGSKNPMYGKKRPDSVILLSKTMKKILKDNPQSHANSISARHGKISVGHKILAVLIWKSYGILPEINFPVRTSVTTRFIDVALVDMKIAFEYDEPYWHDKKLDASRDLELSEAGWITKRAGPWIVKKYKKLESEFSERFAIRDRVPSKHGATRGSRRRIIKELRHS
jgi:very-short-patch-repair endonuclease